MKNSPQPKTVLHGQGAGEISDADLEKRAREIALIQGRGDENVTEEDRAAAYAELSGQTLPETTVDDARSLGALSRDPSDPPSLSGGETPHSEEPNEQAELERIVLEGVEEAQHDQMVEAGKRRQL
jgi:hypothetical protein